ncbi:MAG: YceI family protein [Bacteroidota bacterium]
MKSIHIFLFLGFLGGLLAVHAQDLKLSNAKITFEFPSKNVTGSISGFTSKSRINWEALESSVFEGSVDASSLDTNNGLRNWHLRSSRYFATKTYPRIYFKSSEVKWKEDLLVVKGKLTLKGTTKPITISFRRQGRQLLGSCSIYSSDYGISIKKKREDNLVTIDFSFVAE